jgi:hypothetical protein
MSRRSRCAIVDRMAHAADPARAAARRAILLTLLVAVVAGTVIWLLVFDMWLGQVERQYLWENARHELSHGPAVSLKAMMDEGRAAGARVATAWSLFVAAAIACAGRVCYRSGLMAGTTSGASWTR